LNPTGSKTFTAFAGKERIASGYLQEVANKVQAKKILYKLAPILIFDDFTGHVVEMDLSRTPEELLRRVEEVERASQPGSDLAVPTEGSRGPGRPRLGVVAREVTLLPRHWEWLASQPGGASVALRKLVEVARRTNQEPDRLRHAKEAAYRFMSTMAGNEPGFEEAARALFAGDSDRFARLADNWPVDVATHAKGLAERAWPIKPPLDSVRNSEGTPLEL
jgi:hypothetical protein